MRINCFFISVRLATAKKTKRGKNMGSKLEMSNVEKIKKHFDNSTESQLRGNGSPAAINNYAQFILEKLQISEGRILDIGCGDGRIMEAIQKINPKLSIDGIELSSTLSNTARLLNPNSEIFNINAVNFDTKKKYNRIFSFSFAQYLSSNQFSDLNNRLVLFLTKGEGAKIIHLSIPDWGLRNANYYVEYAKQNRLFLFPARFILNAVNFKRSYGNDGSRYHDPRELTKIHNQNFLVDISRESDSYYRFDIQLKKRNS